MSDAIVQGPGLLLAASLASIHAFSPKLNISAVVPEHRWVSFAGGVSVGYVFLEIFPELSHVQAELEHSAIPFIAYLENHVYILALLGLLVFYGLDILALASRGLNRARNDADRASSLVFWIHIAVFICMNAIFGYLLQDLSEHNLFQCILFFVAVALHFFVIDFNLREHHKSSYDRRGRWFLTAAIMMGAIAAQIANLNEAAVSIVWAFLAGSLILNILKRELPDEQKSCFWSFTGGAALYAVLLLLV
ncbi:bacitracin resistance protein bacA [Rubidibacter lacunae KORDI 51-2]|uniref:Bacitracin resistance protein bacA n=1 Tax=Rubidibacter lacunae KORDI 51-2 TaxID=582515 RepID=U5DFE0_9CHRO|nr:bacitracin resistance protein bacA [Rubidibacter lacunae]ERN43208.1 bacitracin resistance protein bacA [Rubidibacter lacunae KORDI 51-2]